MFSDHIRVGSCLQFDCHVYHQRGGAEGGAGRGQCGYFITKAARLDRTGTGWVTNIFPTSGRSLALLTCVTLQLCRSVDVQ